MTVSIAAALVLVLSVARGSDAQVAPNQPETSTPPPATERVYLSGTGFGDEREWEFRIDGGRRSGEWTTIPVPSQWQQHGFGTYTYGHDEQDAADVGHYRYRFSAPERWRDRRVLLTFDGVMTDAAVSVNGHSAGAVHQGGFYPFSYEVTDLLSFGEQASNLLEVSVSERSSNRSVNRAEREADYWVFGGIFRPVYLEVLPQASIRRVLIDARSDGTARLLVTTQDAPPGATLRASADRLTASSSIVAVDSAQQTEITARFAGAEPWSAETPHLYHLHLDLVAPDGAPLHRFSEHIGFRTFEIRPGGLYVNGSRVVLKGFNRHSFWPQSGRTLNAEINRTDVLWMKAMNANAVRMSHYPPDRSFLDACDELGLYVLDEIAGWHDAYDTAVGTRLVTTTVERDHNRPSVIAWSNGNEDGWNTSLDPLFYELDLQNRPVLHPWDDFGGFDTRHYPDWQELQKMLAGRRFPPTRSLVMPTELLHGLYDGGIGASLEDYWGALQASPRFAGAFLWAFIDEAVARTDRDGELDTAGNYAPDGVLGPYREREASWLTVRELFSPVDARFVSIQRGDIQEEITVELENRYDHSSLERLRLHPRFVRLPRPTVAGAQTSAGGFPAPDAAPGSSAEWNFLAPSFSRMRDAGYTTIPEQQLGANDRWEAFELRIYDAARAANGKSPGPEIMRWVWDLDPGRLRGTSYLAAPNVEDLPPVTAEQGDDGAWTLRAAGTTVHFDASGALASIASGTGTLSLTGGNTDAHGRVSRPLESRILERGSARSLQLRFDQPLQLATWTLHPDGRLHVSYLLETERKQQYVGLGFDYPEEQVRGLRWLGQGPYRVWRNRTRGGWLGLHETPHNRTVTGRSWRYPELGGFYAGVRWAELQTSEGRLLLAPGTPDQYLGLFGPEFPDDARGARAEVPSGINILSHISAIGTKFHEPSELGPRAAALAPAGLHRGDLWIRFLPPDVAALSASE